MLYVIARTVREGRRIGLLSIAGTAVGGGLHVLLGALGIAAIVSASPRLMLFLKVSGCIYLIYLGTTGLLSKASLHRTDPSPQSSEKGIEQRKVTGAFREGFVIESLNPKTSIFFLAFLPQFFSKDVSPEQQFLVLGLICVLLNSGADLIAWSLCKNLAAEHRSARLPNRSLKLLNLASSSVLVILGMIGLLK